MPKGKRDFKKGFQRSDEMRYVGKRPRSQIVTKYMDLLPGVRINDEEKLTFFIEAKKNEIYRWVILL
jgi:hypothetical protein